LKTNSKQDWISDSTRDLIDKKREARLKQDKPLHRKLTKECRAQVRHDRQMWADTLVLEGESMFQSNQLQDTFTNLRKLRPANINFTSSITATDGTLVSDKKRKLRCWKEFYEGMLNRQPINPPEVLHEAASEATPTPSIPVSPPTTDEVHKAISQLRSRRVPGICGITAEGRWHLLHRVVEKYHPQGLGHRFGP